MLHFWLTSNTPASLKSHFLRDFLHIHQVFGSSPLIGRNLFLHLLTSKSTAKPYYRTYINSGRRWSLMTRQRYDVPGNESRIIPRDPAIRPGEVRIYRPGKNGALYLKKVVPFRSSEAEHRIKRSGRTISCRRCGKWVKAHSPRQKLCRPCAGKRNN